MPNVLNESRLNRVRYISMADYVSSMDSLDTLEDKMAFTTRYLLAFGPGQERDVSFEEAIYIARLKIADASAALRARKMVIIPDESVNPYLSDEEDAPYRKFMIDPIGYLQDETNRLIQKEANQGITQANQQRVENYQVMSAVFSNDFNGSMTSRIYDLDAEPSTKWVKARLNGKYNGHLEEAYNRTKPGFLAKAFGKYSKAYSNLDAVYQAYNNPNHALYGDMNSLDKAATEYLQHRFPSWDPKTGLPDETYINRLSGTQKERAQFSLNILKSTAEQRRCERVYETIKNANLQKRAEEEAGIEEDLTENQFQQQVAQEVNNEVEYDSAEAEKEYAANFADDPEVEEEAPALE